MNLKFAYKMPEEEQEIDEIVEHARLFGTLFVSPEQDVISPESARLVDVLKGGIGGCSRHGVRDSAGTHGLPALIRMPFIDIMAAMKSVVAMYSTGGMTHVTSAPGALRGTGKGSESSLRAWTVCPLLNDEFRDTAFDDSGRASRSCFDTRCLLKTRAFSSSGRSSRFGGLNGELNSAVIMLAGVLGLRALIPPRPLGPRNRPPGEELMPSPGRDMFDLDGVPLPLGRGGILPIGGVLDATY